MAENKNNQNNRNNKSFATFGSDSYKLEGAEVKSSADSRITLNIEEDSSQGVVLESVRKRRVEATGNPIVDLFNRINMYMIQHSKIKINVKANFFHLLSVMINSGIPMVKSLNALADQSVKTPKMKYIIEEMGENIIAGASLSKSLFMYPDVFSEQEIGMIQAGEASGQLSKVLGVLAHDTEKASSIRKKVKSALMYPMVLFSLLIVVVAVMLIYVIPQLTELFASAGGELPLITRIVVALSDFFVKQKVILLLAVIVLTVFIIVFKKTEQGKYFFDLLLIKIPVFGELFQKSYLSRFARSLSNLLDSSVSILKTLEITANSIGNEVYRRRLMLSMEDVKQGIPLAENLTESDLFPPMTVSMIEDVEQTAQLDTITAKVADFYENEVDTAVAGLSKIIEPIMLIVIGLTVGAVVAAIMLPIMNLANLAGSL